MNITNTTTLIEEATDEKSLFRYDMLLVTLSSMLIGIAIDSIKNIGYFLIVCIFNNWETTGAVQGQTMDNIMANGFCESRQLTHSSLPANGINVSWVKGPVVTFRKSSIECNEGNRRGYDRISKHTIWCVRFAKSSEIIKKQLLGEDDIFSITYVGTDNCPVSIKKSNIKFPYEWQLYAADCIYNVYTVIKNVTVLLCGPVGTGKTKLSEVLAKTIAIKSKVKPKVRTGCNLSRAGFSIGDIPIGTKLAPIIFVNDEFDCTIEHAEKAEEKGKREDSLAHDFSTLATALDILNRLPYFIFFATSNKSIKELSEIREGAYIRDGRIEIKIQLEIDPETDICYLKNIKTNEKLKNMRKNIVIVNKEHSD